MAELKLAEQKFSGEPWQNKKWSKCKKVSRTKMVEQKFSGDPWSLGSWNPKCKCKKVSRTKNGGTKIGRIKIWWGPSAIGWQGPPIASAKRPAEQKMAELKLAE